MNDELLPPVSGYTVRRANGRVSVTMMAATVTDELPPLPVFPVQLHDCLTPTGDRLVRRLMREYAAAAVARERERIVDIVLIELDCNGQAGAIIAAIRNGE